jgi:hypothetical protein
MRFQDIPKFTRNAGYHVTVSWRYLEQHIKQNQNPGSAVLDLDPDFQRAHVWTEQQQTRYVEYILRGGMSSRAIYLNCVGWMHGFKGPYVLVDGKQRLQAVRRFLANEIPAFGARFSEYTDRLHMDYSFDWYVNDLSTRAEVLQWYLDLNSGGVVHTSEELDKVKLLLAQEKQGV